MFWAEIWKKYQNFYLKTQFLVVKFSIYLKRRVFVMITTGLWHREQPAYENTIVFKGRHVQVVFPTKPTKFGINVWEGVISQNGYVLEVQIYIGIRGGVEQMPEWYKIWHTKRKDLHVNMDFRLLLLLILLLFESCFVWKPSILGIGFTVLPLYVKVAKGYHRL